MAYEDFGDGKREVAAIYFGEAKEKWTTILLKVDYN